MQVQDRGTQGTQGTQATGLEAAGTQAPGLEAAGTSGATPADPNVSGFDLDNSSFSFLTRTIADTYIDQSTPAGADEMQELQLPDANQQHADNATARDGVTGLDMSGF